MRVSSHTLAVLMEQTKVPYHFYASTIFNGPTVASTKSSLQVLISRGGWRIRMISFWLLLSTIHVLGFPTLWSVATGYVNPSYNIWKLPDGNLADATDLRQCLQIEDGSRVGLKDNQYLLYGGLYDDYFRLSGCMPVLMPPARC